MKIFLKVSKLIGLSILSILLITILVSLAYRYFSPTPKPSGNLIDVGGYKLHINSTGEKNSKPTLVLESGAGAPGEHLHWISENLKDSIRVVRYDRAGIGYSDFGFSDNNVEAAVKDLHKLLELAGESPPYIMAGHSYGGHYIRIFTKLYPEEVAAMVFLDSSNPDAGERLNLPSTPWWFNSMYEIGAVLGDLGVLHLYDKIKGPILWAPGLPEKITERTKDYSYDGKFIRGYLRRDGNSDWVRDLKELSSAAKDFGSLPIRVFSGTHQRDEALSRLGVDPDKFRKVRVELQQEIADLSTDSELFLMDGGHVTIFTEKTNADFIADKLFELLRDLENK